MKLEKKLLICISVIVSTLICACAKPVTVTSNAEHEKITKDFIAIMEENPEVKALVEESIAIAGVINPDRKTNPVTNLKEYYDFLDWSAVCMPWNILKDQEEVSIYKQIDQSLDYFYYLLDQPLPELAGKGLYYPCLEYYEPIASWCKEYAAEWGEFLSAEESWNDTYYQLACRDKSFGMDKGWYASENVWTSFNDFFARLLLFYKTCNLSSH